MGRKAERGGFCHRTPEEGGIAGGMVATNWIPAYSPGMQWSGLLSVVFLISPLIGAEPPSERVIAFYYGWYGNPQTDGNWHNWNHSVINPRPGQAKQFPGGEDIGANYFPDAGAYSVNDPKTLDRQMSELRAARVGVISASWWGEEHFTGRNLPRLLDAAAKHELKVCIHLEPYGGRNAANTREKITQIIDKYGMHPALFRSGIGGKRPLFFVYDSYLTPASEWAEVLAAGGKNTIRGTKYDSAVIGLWVKENDGKFMTNGHFDGFYTYFGADGFTYGSSSKNWGKLASFAREHKMLFIPSVGPGYVDTRIRPWNGSTTRSREGGRYYDRMWQGALNVAPKLISITSYNEWHEGTQIEPAVPKKIETYTYEDYSPQSPDHYLKRTAYWVQQFERSAPR